MVRAESLIGKMLCLGDPGMGCACNLKQLCGILRIRNPRKFPTESHKEYAEGHGAFFLSGPL
jgi:hypothetical protein